MPMSQTTSTVMQEHHERTCQGSALGAAPSWLDCQNVHCRDMKSALLEEGTQLPRDPRLAAAGAPDASGIGRPWQQ
jgi:hypothetical protein